MTNIPDDGAIWSMNTGVKDTKLIRQFTSVPGTNRSIIT